MKKIVLAGMLLISSLGIVQADNGWGIMASGWKPQDGKQSYGPGIKFQFEMTPGLVLDLRGTYFSDVSDQSEIELKVIPFEGGLSFQLQPMDMINVYLGGGAGYYRMDGSYNEIGRPVVDFDPEDSIGYYANVAVEFLVTGSNVQSFGATYASLFIEAMYREISVDKASVNHTTYAVQKATLSGLGVNVGIMLRW